MNLINVSASSKQGAGLKLFKKLKELLKLQIQKRDSTNSYSVMDSFNREEWEIKNNNIYKKQ